MKGFATGIEHLLAELQVLDLLLRRQVMRLRAAHLFLEDEMRGLYISDGQINALLNQQEHLHEAWQGDETKEIQELTEAIEHLRRKNEERVQASQDLPLPRLATLFDLTPFECQVLLIAVAPELDLRYETLYAYAQNDATKKHPSIDLALKILCRGIEEHASYRSIFAASAPLLRHQLLRLLDDPQEREPSLLARYLKVDQRIVNFLLGDNTVDQRTAPFTQRLELPQSLSDLTIAEELRSQLLQMVRLCKTGSAVLFFHGPPGVGKQAAAEAICAELQRPLLVADVSLMPDADRGNAFALLRREAILQGASLYLAHFETLLPDDATHGQQRQSLIRELLHAPFPLFLGSEVLWHPQGGWPETRFVEVAFPLPDFPLRLQVWKSVLGEQKHHAVSDEDITLLADQFVLSGGQIHNAMSEARTRAALHPSKQALVSREDLYAATRAQSNHNLRQLAQKVELIYTWSDIVLPVRALNQLHEVCASVKYHHVVFSDWGFERRLALGKGLNVLFSGSSGTGKTMAVGIIAHELGRDLYKIDLSHVVSKYIGETEKNLSHIFREAQASNAILFFDEADALFGKRSEVKDAHDRYANIEVAYLLQKMEEYTGIVILATNLSRNLDDAFARRMRYVVEFPFPDAPSRERIWRGMFPTEAPLDKDVDFAFLARQFELAGGSIRNIVMAAALMAAEEGSIIRMEHLVVSTARELQKMGKMPSQANFRNYYELIRQRS